MDLTHREWGSRGWHGWCITLLRRRRDRKQAERGQGGRQTAQRSAAGNAQGESSAAVNAHPGASSGSGGCRIKRVRAHPMIKINMYKDSGTWFGARWIDGEYDGCDELGCDDSCSDADAIA